MVFDFNFYCVTVKTLRVLRDVENFLNIALASKRVQFKRMFKHHEYSKILKFDLLLEFS